MKLYKGKTPAQWVDKHESVNALYDMSEPCEYGHFGCSCSGREGGPCLDEMLGEVEEHERERAVRPMKFTNRQLMIANMDLAMHFAVSALLAEGGNPEQVLDAVQLQFETHPSTDHTASLRNAISFAITALLRSGESVESIVSFTKEHAEHVARRLEADQVVV